MGHRTCTFHTANDEPEEPDTPGTEEKKSTEPSVNELESRLLKGRKIMVFGQINDKLARGVVARILTLAEESTKPIQIYVNSPGGHVESGDTIHDIVKFVRSSVPIYMIGTGWVASAGALIYAAGEKKAAFLSTEYALPAASADGRRAGPCNRHRHRGARDDQDARALEPDHRHGDRSINRAGPQGHRAELLDVRVRGGRLRPRLQDHQLDRRAAIARSTAPRLGQVIEPLL